MKKFGRIIVCCILIAVITMTAVACEQKDANGLIILKKPKAEMSGNTINWSPVKHATEYGVVIDEEEEVTTTSTSYPLMNINKNVNVKVRAIGDGKKYTNSEYSATLNYDPKINLVSPDGVAINVNDDKSVKLTWKAVENASGYEAILKLDGKTVGESIKTGELECVFAKENFEKAGAYMFTVKAIGNDDKYITSRESESVPYTVKLKLANPTALLGTSTSTGTIKFKKVENSDKYYVRLLKDGKLEDSGEAYATIDNPSINSEDVSLDIKKFTIKDAGKYTIEVKASRKGGASSFYWDSDWVKVNLKSDESKQAELTQYAAPTGIKLNEKILTWDAVEGAPRYMVNMKSGTNSYKSGTDKMELNLAENSDLFADGAETKAGGRAVYLSVFVAENLDEGILQGLPTTEMISIQSYKEPTKDGEYYIVDNLMHLAYISQNPTAKYKLSKNIDASGSYLFGFTDSFDGEFDGNNFTINNFVLIPRSGAGTATLFGNIGKSGVVKNLGLLENKFAIIDNTLIDNADKKVDCALVANTNEGIIDSVFISSGSSSNNMVDTEGKFAGVAIVNNGTINNCSFAGKVRAYNSAAGITTENNGNIFNSFIFLSEITAQTVQPVGVAGVDDGTVNAIAGGIASINNGGISGCGNDSSKVTAKAQGTKHNAYAGGIVGLSNDGTIKECYVGRAGTKSSQAGISALTFGAEGKGYGGGFIGKADGTAIKSIYNQFMAVKSTGVSGGLIGELGANSTLDNSYSIADTVSGITRGGFIGKNSGTVTKSYYAGYYAYAKDQKLKAIGSGDASGFVTIGNGEAEKMLTLDLEGFIVNDKVVSSVMILSNVPYFGKDYAYNNGVATKDKERENFPKIYIGDKDSDGNNVPIEPNIKASTNTMGYRFDRFDISHGEVKYVMARVIRIS